MKYTQRMVTLTFSGIVAVGVTASGCATPWFATDQHSTDSKPTVPHDLKQATVTYINGLCKLPKEERDPTVRELNESLLPNHAAISCGRAGAL